MATKCVKSGQPHWHSRKWNHTKILCHTDQIGNVKKCRVWEYYVLADRTSLALLVRVSTSTITSENSQPLSGGAGVTHTRWVCWPNRRALLQEDILSREQAPAGASHWLFRKKLWGRTWEIHDLFVNTKQVNFQKTIHYSHFWSHGWDQEFVQHWARCLIHLWSYPSPFRSPP